MLSNCPNASPNKVASMHEVGGVCSAADFYSSRMRGVEFLGYSLAQRNLPYLQNR